MVVACIALAVALGGTSYAAIKLPAGSVGTKQLKKNAVTSPKVKNNALTGADVLESSLAQVPSAASATNATSAGSETTAGTANAAFSMVHGARHGDIPRQHKDTAAGRVTHTRRGTYRESSGVNDVNDVLTLYK